MEIGYVAGSHASLDRRMEQVRAVVQQAARPYRLVTVPRGYIRPGLPIIVDVTLESPQTKELVSICLSRIMPRPWLWMHMSGYSSLADSLAARLPLRTYRNAINTRPLVLEFLENIPQELHVPTTHYVTTT